MGTSVPMYVLLMLWCLAVPLIALCFAVFFPSLCIFCGERNESFTEEGLDLHYWKRCPMLTRCEHCKQVRHHKSVAVFILLP